MEYNYNKIRIELGALVTGMFYSAQFERIKAFNRIRQIMYRKIEGKELTEKSDKKEESEKFQDLYNDKKLIKYINENKIKLSTEEQGYVDKLIKLLDDSLKNEKLYKTWMHDYIELEPIYDKWLKNVKGISTISTSNLLQYFGYCEKAKHCSSLWKYAGLHVVNGHSPKREKTTKEEKSEGKSNQLDWNPKLRSLLYRIGDSFIKQRTPIYRDIYDKEKERQLKLGGWNEEKRIMKDKDKEGAPQRLLHADLRARRKMVKEFLRQYYVNCLLIRGIEPDLPYSARYHQNEKI